MAHRQPPPQPPPNSSQRPPTAHNSPPTAQRLPRSTLPPQMPPQMAQSLIMLSEANEATWNLVGNLAEQMNDPDRAESAYEHALRHNPESERALTQVASIARAREDFPKAIEFFQRALDVRQENGEVWSALGHCYLMQDDLQKAYTAYQQALYHLPNPKDPKLWYGIGILYDRYGSLDNAEEAFASVMRMDSKFEKAEEILFRLGIIYKQQQKYPESLDCFDRILRNPPAPLANLDIWFQIGHVYEQAKNFEEAKAAYERVLAESPNHAKVLQQLGWLYHQPGSSFTNQDMAINYLTKSLEADSSDAQSWYLLGRAFMTVQKYQKAYEAYQQAVYRDGRNPTFWCSIGVLYYNINQYRDALDAYSRAIRINPYISEVWYDLGSLYESCNNQIGDAIDAYTRAADLDPNNQSIKARLRMLKEVQTNGGTLPAAPGPQDVHPTAYASTHGPPNSIGNGPSLGASSHSRQPGGHSRSDSRTDHPMNGGATRDLPAPSPSGRAGRTSSDTYRHSELGQEPFRGGPPPPLNIDENAPRRGSASHAALAPMDLDRIPHSYPEPPRTGGSGPNSSHQPPLHHPVPQPPLQPLQSIPDIQQPSSTHPSHSLPPIGRSAYDHPDPPRRMSPPSESPRVSGRRAHKPPSPPSAHQAPPPYPPRNSYTPATQGLPPPSTSAHHGLPYDRNTATSTAHPERHDPPWERRHNRHDSRNGLMEHPAPHSNGFRSPALTNRVEPNGPPPQSSSYGPPPNRSPPPPHPSRSAYDRRPRSPGPQRAHRDASLERPGARSPYPNHPPPQWSGPPQQPPGSLHSSPNGSRRASPPGTNKRYLDGEQPRREGWEREGPAPPRPPQPQHPDRSENGTPDARVRAPNAPPVWRKESESPHPGSTRATVEPPKERRRRGAPKVDKDNGEAPAVKAPKEKKERKAPAKRGAASKVQASAEKDELPPPSSAANSPPTFRSSRPSPPQWSANPTPPLSRPAPGHRTTRSVDEDYDEEGPEVDRSEGQNNAVAALMDLASYRTNRDTTAAQPQRTGSSGRIESLLNGPPSEPSQARMSIDHVRSPVGHLGGTKRMASDEDHSEAARKRSRVSSSSTSPMAPTPMPSLSPVNNGPRNVGSGTSRRTSMDIGSQSGSRRSWADGPEHEHKPSSMIISRNGTGSANSPKALPPISTLPSAPASPSGEKGRTSSMGSVSSPRGSGRASPMSVPA